MVKIESKLSHGGLKKAEVLVERARLSRSRDEVLADDTWTIMNES